MWELRRYKGLSYSLTAARAGKDYDPGLGFELREDFTQFTEQVAYGWIIQSDTPLAQHQFTFRSEWYLRNSDRETDTFNLIASWGGFWKNGSLLMATLQRSFVGLTEEFELSDDAIVDPGKYSYVDGQLFFQSSESRRFWAQAILNIGSFFDGTRFSINLQPTLNASRYFNLTGTYQYNKIDFPGRDQSFTAHIARIHAEPTLNRAFSISSFVQFNSADDITLTNFRLRYNPREGNDFYLVYNEGFNMDRLIESPRLPFSDGRTILLKYSYTFIR